ncbi:hypothetical protein T07_2848 [Trichinella nelsoni]|uniref:Uncharacterized protein n=1 Tax=Trichinella nelsoni TaxID=6336 RepID=A0A0V0SIZ4_9BILA|nr:hypothetical protein T07_2848 [Trichinella nelsoni]
MHTEKYQSKKRHGCGEQSRGTEHFHHDNPSLGAEQQFDDDGGGDCFEPLSVSLRLSTSHDNTTPKAVLCPVLAHTGKPGIPSVRPIRPIVLRPCFTPV